jgi:hypothetical protein
MKASTKTAGDSTTGSWNRQLGAPAWRWLLARQAGAGTDKPNATAQIAGDDAKEKDKAGKRRPRE